MSDYYANQFVEYQGRQVNIYEAWKRHPKRESYPQLYFDPSKQPGPNPDGFNMWQGFTVEPHPGDVSVFLDFMRDIICNGDEVLFDYLVKYIALLLQRPALLPKVAFVMRGDKGVGKGTFVDVIGSLFGSGYFQAYDQRNITGAFTEHLRNVVVLFLDEAFFAGDKRHESTLKGIITEETQQINQKNLPLIVVPNMMTVFMAANSSWVVPASINERRYCVSDVSDKRMKDYAYFQQVRDTDRAALLWHFQSVKLDGFNVYDYPDTEGLVNQKRESLDAFDKWFLDFLNNGRSVVHGNGFSFERQPRTAVFDDYMRSRAKVRAKGDSPDNETMFGQRLKATMPDGWPKRGTRMAWEERGVMKESNGYKFPPLDDWRAHVQQHYFKFGIEFEGVAEDFTHEITKTKAKLYDDEHRLINLEASLLKEKSEFIAGKLKQDIKALKEQVKTNTQQLAALIQAQDDEGGDPYRETSY
jgi:hypothetical protein